MMKFHDAARPCRWIALPSLRQLRQASVCLAALAAAIPGVGLASDIVPPKVNVTTPGGINASNGGFAYSVIDLSMGPLSLERYIVVGSGLRRPNDPMFGRHMSHNFDIFVASNTNLAASTHRPIVHIGSTASGVYAQSGGDLSRIVPDNRDAESGRLEWAGGNSWSTGHYIYTDQAGIVYTFSSAVSAAGVPFNSQRVATIAFPDGAQQSFSYNTSGQLKLVSDSRGYALVFDYNAGGDVAAACAFNTASTYVSSSSTCASAGLKTTYSYDTNGDLVSAIDAAGNATNYPNNTARGVTCIQPPGFTTCQMSMTYDSEGRVTQQTLADGGTWIINSGPPSSMNDPDMPATQDGENETFFIDPAGVTTNFTFTKNSPYSMTDANGRTTQYRFTGAVSFSYTGAPYSDGSLLVQAILPEGNRFEAEYAGPFNSVSRQRMVAATGSTLPDQVREFDYPACSGTTIARCTKAIAVRDVSPAGSSFNTQVDFTYNARGQVLTEMQPAPAANAARPLKVYTYSDRFAWLRSSGGTLVQGATPHSMPATVTVCQTAAGNSVPACDAAAPQVVTSFEYGANGTADSLRLLGTVVTADGISRRTCVSYDAQGNKLSETAPRANRASCP